MNQWADHPAIFGRRRYAAGLGRAGVGVLLTTAAATLSFAIAGAGEMSAPAPQPPLPQPGLEIFDSIIPPAPPAQFTTPAPETIARPAPGAAMNSPSRYPDATPNYSDSFVGDSPETAGPADGSEYSGPTGTPPGQPRPPSAAAESRRRESERVDLLSDPNVYRQTPQPGYRPPDLRRAPVPPPQPGFGAPAAPVAPIPAGPPVQAGGGYDYDPYADPGAGFTAGPSSPPVPGGIEYGPPPGQGYLPAGPGQYGPDDYAPPPAESYQPPATDVFILQSLNTRNRAYPGLGQAVRNGDLTGAGAIILDVLRQRRTVDTALTLGPRWSMSAGVPGDTQTLQRVMGQGPIGPEDPLVTAQRVNTILDSFHSNAINDPALGGPGMGMVLERLHDDIRLVRGELLAEADDGVFLELSRTYLRAITESDFFSFPRKELSGDIRYLMERGSGMFYPDGSSRGGDVLGVTGNLFLDMLHLNRFANDLGGRWRFLEHPARYLQEIACPDGTLPRYGPRGTVEIGPGDLAAIRDYFQLHPPRGYHPGLIATSSYPAASNIPNLGGVYVSRDGRDPNSRYLAVRFGPPSTLTSVPSHADFGQLVLMTRGQKLLDDPGGYGGFAASGAAHGSLLLNGVPTETASYSPAGSPSEALWRTNGSFDYSAGRALFPDGKAWQRGILYVKNLPSEIRTDYWMILDTVEMQGDPQPRTAQIRYTLAPGASAQPDGPGLVLSAGGMGTGVRMYAVDVGSRLDGSLYGAPMGGMNSAGTAPVVTLTRQLVGDTTTTTLLYPADDFNHRPARIDRDSDIIRGKTGAIVIDHGGGKLDVVAWAPPGAELVTPTLNLQLAADLAVFRVRRGKIARVDFVNLQRFQAKEPDGGMWSMRVMGPPQTITVEPEAGGGWQVLSDPSNHGSAQFVEVNLGPVMTKRNFSLRPGELRVLPR